MMMLFMYKKVVVFDLDDTLYKEIYFLKSGYRKVAELVANQYGCDVKTIYDQLLNCYYNGKNAFAFLNERYRFNIPIEKYLDVYRYHHPTLTLSKVTKEALSLLIKEGIILGIITDGRKISQKQKFEALGLEEWIPSEMVMINEDEKYFKPSLWSYNWMMFKCYKKYPKNDFAFYYIGDNTEKDFVAPNQLGWTSICLLDNGKNIHKQNFDIPNEYLPKFKVESISEIIGLI